MKTITLGKDDEIETRYLNAGGLRIAVELRQSASGSVAARFFLGPSDAPIVDAPTKEAALNLVQCALDVLLARRSSNPG